MPGGRMSSLFQRDVIKKLVYFWTSNYNVRVVWAGRMVHLVCGYGLQAGSARMHDVAVSSFGSQREIVRNSVLSYFEFCLVVPSDLRYSWRSAIAASVLPLWILYEVEPARPVFLQLSLRWRQAVASEGFVGNRNAFLRSDQVAFFS
jgi:hypothetical protein